MAASRIEAERERKRITTSGAGPRTHPGDMAAPGNQGGHFRFAGHVECAASGPGREQHSPTFGGVAAHQ